MQLTQIINQIASGGHSGPGTGFAGPEKMSRVEALRALDPLLDRLYKDYQDAKAGWGRLVRKYGPDSLLTQIAADQRDSLQTAYETRLLELLADETIKEKAKALAAPAAAPEERDDKSAARMSGWVLTNIPHEIWGQGALWKIFLALYLLQSAPAGTKGMPLPPASPASSPEGPSAPHLHAA